MDATTDITSWAWAWVLQNLLTRENGFILLFTWGVIEFVMTPLAEWVVGLPVFVRHRLTLYSLQKMGKRTAGAVWCSLLMWIPTAQPPLCPEGVTDSVAAGCQLVFQRLSIGMGLGLILSGAHAVLVPYVRKKLGLAKRVRTVCINCRRKVRVSSLEGLCPECHEPTTEKTDYTRAN